MLLEEIILSNELLKKYNLVSLLLDKDIEEFLDELLDVYCKTHNISINFKKGNDQLLVNIVNDKEKKHNCVITNEPEQVKFEFLNNNNDPFLQPVKRGPYDPIDIRKAVKLRDMNISVKQAASILNCSESAVYNYYKLRTEKEIKQAIKQHENCRRNKYPKESVDKAVNMVMSLKIPVEEAARKNKVSSFIIRHHLSEYKQKQIKKVM